MTDDAWLRRQHQLARAAGLVGLTLVLGYFGVGGLLIRLSTDGGAYFDASPRPEWYFEFFGEISYLLAIILSPALLATAVIAALSAWTTFRPNRIRDTRAIQFFVGAVGVVAQIAFIAAEF